MATQRQGTDETAPAQAAGSSLGDQGHYTGVVVIHGLGDEKRNDTIIQVVDALTYWYNHEAGLALRPTGPGRVWLTTELTEDVDPDAPASRATIEIEAPDGSGGSPAAGGTLRLELREVWWAQSFGLQPLATTINWARVQFADQARHMLVPVGRLLGRSRTAVHAPAGDSTQALASGTLSDGSGTASSSASPSAGLNKTARPSVGLRARRRLLGALLGIYSGVQYVWKAVQWLVLTPLILFLLLIMGLLRALSFIGIIRSALIAGFTALTGYVMLHWIASTQVYMRDYTLASAIRQRFDREVDAFLRDERCDRLVVIAHSMGTVIAYEGLTTRLTRPQTPGDAKPITFICLAQALRRVWLLPGIDPRRLRGVLPERVRWLHFWSHYDLVAVGPLSPRTLPRVEGWSDPSMPDPYDAICASLERCQNFDVVNTDSTFTDHTTYWDNLEQVVGPIALELVAGHAAIEPVVRAHQATPDGVLLRRWEVAWRYAVALASGLAAGLGLLVWAILNPAPIRALTALVQQVDWGALLASVCPACGSIRKVPASQLPQSLQQFAHFFAFAYFIQHDLTLAVLVVGALTLLAATVGMQLVGILVARPSPYDFPRMSAGETGDAQWVFILSAVTMVLALVTSLLFTIFVRAHVTVEGSATSRTVALFFLSLGVAELAAGVAFWIGVFGMVSNRQWAWLAWVFFAAAITFTYDPFYRTALLCVAVVGCLVALIRLSGTGRAGLMWAIVMQLAIILYIGIGALLGDLKLVPIGSPGTGAYIEPVLPAFIYGLWSGPAGVRSGPSNWNMPRRIILGLAAAYAGFVFLLRLSALVSGSAHIVRTTAALGELSIGSVWGYAAALAALAALALSLADAARSRRWGWLVAIPLALGALGAWFALLRTSGVALTVPDDLILFALAPLSAALTYALWAGPTTGHATKPRGGRTGQNAAHSSVRPVAVASGAPPAGSQP